MRWRRASSSCPRGDRDLLRMRFEPGATNRSVARAMGYSEIRVSRTLNRTYGDLLECIQRRVVFERPRRRPMTPPKVTPGSNDPSALLELFVAIRNE